MVSKEAIKTRALQNATIKVKKAIKKYGQYKWNQYSAAERKGMAWMVLEGNPSMIETARRQLQKEERRAGHKKATQKP